VIRFEIVRLQQNLRRLFSIIVLLWLLSMPGKMLATIATTFDALLT
jgi:hypothetical protein